MDNGAIYTNAQETLDLLQSAATELARREKEDWVETNKRRKARESQRKALMNLRAF